MGGMGSGNFGRRRRKRTVEQTLAIAVGDFTEGLLPDTDGQAFWVLPGLEVVVASYYVFDAPLEVKIEFECCRSRKRISRFGLQTTRTQFGGERTWLVCHHFREGQRCNKRVGKLYLPEDETVLGCRECHDLTYRSSQTAHREERLTKRIEQILKMFDSLDREDG